MGNVTLRSYRLGDERGIVDLATHVGPHLRTIDYWNWQNTKNPFGPAIIELAEENGSIVGHYAVNRFKVRQKDSVYEAGFASQAYIHRGKRDLKLLMGITKRIWKRCADEGLSFVYGFPNDNIWAIKKRLMNWRTIADFKSYEYLLSQHGKPGSLLKSAGKKDIKVGRLNSFGPGFDGFEPHDCLHIPRTANFLNWRFFSNPLQHYLVFGAWVDEQPAGYVVLKLRRQAGRVLGHFVDLATSPANRDVAVSTLFNSAFDMFVWQGVDVISCWSFKTDPFHQMLVKAGFEQTGFTTHFGYRLTREAPLAALDNADNWYITMADSDAF